MSFISPSVFGHPPAARTTTEVSRMPFGLREHFAGPRDGSGPT
jgi:hypothetical protein